MGAARITAAIAQCATVLLTRALWTRRESPPLLPIGPEIPWSFDGALLATALATIVLPRAGSAMHFAVLALAMAADQTRAQPSVLCLAIVLLGTGWGPGAVNIARAHVASMWLFAGVHKLLSPGWFAGTAPWLLSAIVARPSPALSRGFAWGVALGETALGVMAIIPRTRPIAALGAVALHLGALHTLGPLGHRWNEAIWPWNLALALLGPLLFLGFREPLARTVREGRPAVLGASALLLLGPLLWSVGLYPPYFAHHLYSEDLPTARWCTPRAGATDPRDRDCADDRGDAAVYAALRVPMPPAVATIRAHFEATCRAGELLEINDPRGWFIRRGLGRITVVCPRR